MNIFLFITANKHEREAFEKKFIRHEEKYILGKKYYLGKFGRYSAAYIHMKDQGVINPSATALVGILIQELQPIAVVMAGIAFGADRSRQKIGDVLVSDKILPYDSQKLLEDKTIYKEIPKEVGFQLLNAFRECEEWKYLLPDSTKSEIHIGSVLTGSRLVNNFEFRSQLLKDFAVYRPIGGEKEAQGIYSACRLYGVAEWIIIKGICDWGYEKSYNKDNYQIIAANAAVDYCFNVFSRDGVFDSLVKSDNEKKAHRDNHANVMPTINITNTEGDNYTGNAVNNSLGNRNTFNAPIYNYKVNS